MWHPVPGPRISAYPLVCPLKWCVQREQRVETTGTIQIQPNLHNTAAAPTEDYLYEVSMIFSSKTRLQCMNFRGNVDNLIKSKLSITWKSQKSARTGNKLTCKTLLRLPSLDWRLTGTVSGVRAVSPVCQENSKTKSILLYLRLTVLPILHSPLNQ